MSESNSQPGADNRSPNEAGFFAYRKVSDMYKCQRRPSRKDLVIIKVANASPSETRHSHIFSPLHKLC